MDREILIVSADRQLYQGIEKTCKKSCPDNISLTHVDDTKTAADRLRGHSIALVIIGRLPHEESIISFLFYIWHCYPDIPIFNITGEQEFPESLMIEEDGLTLQSGRTALPVQMWPEVIVKALHHEQEGGFLSVNDVSNFAQMIENEVRTCTLRVIDHTDSRLGVLFFEKGKLKNARLKTVQGEIAAYVILSWENVRITVQDSCDISSPKIQSNLQALLIESQVKKDHQEQPHSNSAAWIEAAQEEKQNYQQLLNQHSTPQTDQTDETDETDENEEEISKLSPPSESGIKKIGPLSMAAVITIGLALIMATVYLVNAQLKRSTVERTLDPTPKHSIPDAAPVKEAVAPPSEMKPKQHQVEVIKGKHATESSPPANQPAAALEKKSPPQQSVSSPPKIMSPDKEAIDKVTTDNATLPSNQKKIDSTAEPSTPLSLTKESENEPTSHDTRMTPEPPADEVALKSNPSIPEPVDQKPLNSVYIHYTRHKNRSLAFRLADHLIAENFQVPRIEQAEYKKNDIRYFHPADQDLAIELKSQVVGFLRETFPGKNEIQFRMKNLAKFYPKAPRGQLEIWLNLPAN